MPRGQKGTAGGNSTGNTHLLQQGDPGAPSWQELMLFFNMVKNLKNKPEFDWDAIAKDSGFKNASSAKTRFSQIKKQYNLDASIGSSRAKHRQNDSPLGRVPAEASETPGETGKGKGKGKATSRSSMAQPKDFDGDVEDDEEDTGLIKQEVNELDQELGGIEALPDQNKSRPRRTRPARRSTAMGEAGKKRKTGVTGSTNSFEDVIIIDDNSDDDGDKQQTVGQAAKKAKKE